MVQMKPNPVAQFTCGRYPYLRIRDLKFNAGVLLVYSEGDAELVRGTGSFGIEIAEVPIDTTAHVDLKPTGGVARTGMQTSASSEAPIDKSRVTPEEAPAPEGVLPIASAGDSGEPPRPTDGPVAPEPEDDSVTAKPGGWYEYKGKNYRKAALPPEVRDLV